MLNKRVLFMRFILEVIVDLLSTFYNLTGKWSMGYLYYKLAIEW